MTGGPHRRVGVMSAWGILATTIVVLGACGGGGSTRSETAALRPAVRPRVIATTTMLGDVVRAVAGDRADVTVLMAPGDDPRTFTPPPGAGDAITGADLIVATGLGFEAGLGPALDQARSAGTPVFDAAAAVAPSVGPDGAADPHVWMDPDRLGTIATQVADRLAAVAGGDASPWSSAAAAYSKDMAAADEAVQAILLVIPADRRTFLTSSDGLAYFTQRYDLTPRPGTPNVDAGVLVIDVDSLGPVGSATATNAGLLTDTASRIAAATTGQP
jgi:zinc/manganese transport system substrate-binding protein